jgi:hypothetical protein
MIEIVAVSRHSPNLWRSGKSPLNALLLFSNYFFFHICSGSRRKLSTLAIYTEEDSTFDMSDLTPHSDENGSSDKMETNVSTALCLAREMKVDGN